MSAFYEGGYQVLTQQLVSGSAHKHSQLDPDCLSDVQLDAINHVQRTAWCVNSNVLTLMRECYEEGAIVNGLPLQYDEDVPPKMPDDQWDALTADERRQYKYDMSLIHQTNAERLCKRENFLRKLNVAEEMSGEGEESSPIWFPHFYDFRTRMYPMSQDLNPQGDQLARALLQFHTPKRLGESGVKWFCIGMANAFGIDKKHFEERELFTLFNKDLIIDSAMNPLDGEAFWLKADEPFLFWAHCVEYAEMMSMKNPADYESRLPGAMDGVTNGLQHLSLIAKDWMGALKTNCSDDPTRHDLYTDVATAVKDAIAAEVIEGNELAVAWAGNVVRDTVKRAVMTTPYGVTPRGIIKQLVAAGFCDGLDENLKKYDLASYMKDLIVAALSTVMAQAMEIMNYFKSIGRVLGDLDIPMVWKTSAGGRVTQSYYRMTGTTVRTLLGRTLLWSEDQTLGIDSKKCSISAAPNIVHSQDAAMLQLTVCKLAEQHGVTSFAMIHDSYGVPYADVQDMHTVLREVARDMYQGDWLGDFHRQMIALAHPGTELPVPPQAGTFDVSRIINAPYFFS